MGNTGNALNYTDKERTKGKKKKKKSSVLLLVYKISTRAIGSSLSLSVSPGDNHCLPQRPDSHFVTDIPTLRRDVQKAVYPVRPPAQF